MLLFYAYFREKITGKHIFPRKISYKQICREQLPNSHLIKIFSQKIVPLFHMLLTSFAFFYKKLREKSTFLYFHENFRQDLSYIRKQIVCKYAGVGVCKLSGRCHYSGFHTNFSWLVLNFFQPMSALIHFTLAKPF